MSKNKDIGKEIAKCQAQIQALEKQFEEALASKKGDATGSRADSLPGHNLKLRKVLRGHFGKVYAMNWCHAEGKENLLVSASQDGKLIVWDALTTNKKLLIPLRSAWVMSVAYSTSGEFLACGGLDNVASIYKLDEIPPVDEKKRFDPPPKYELAAHDGYLSSCKFLSDTQMVTSSGDSTIILWDVPRRQVVRTFTGHTSDVMSVTATNNGNTLFSGGCDTVAKVWDLRTGTCTQTHSGHEADINSVAIFPDQHGFATASDDSTVRQWDMRCWGEVNCFSNPKLVSNVTSCAFSGSGRLLFAGYDGLDAHVWDTVKGTQLSPSLGPHENRVSCLGVNKAGTAVCTGSWDTSLKCWA